jgi:hypothetical protein
VNNLDFRLARKGFLERREGSGERGNRRCVKGYEML